MKTKGIKAILRKKVNDWANHIDDVTVKQAVLKDTIITGGAIASLLLNEEVKDFDVYFKTRDTAKKVADYYVKKMNDSKPGLNARVEETFGNSTTGVPGRIKIVVQSAGVAAENDNAILENPFDDVYNVINETEEVTEDMINEKSGAKYRPIFLSANAITLANKIQIVIRFFGDAEEIHKNYDFVHCTNYWESKTNNLVLKKEALECLMNRELRYQGSRYPLCSVIRTRKFIRRGFQINAGQYLKMLFQASQLDLTNIDVLQDQLVGVDSTYFDSMIRGLRTKMDYDKNFKISESYVAEIIDRIF